MEQNKFRIEFGEDWNNYSGVLRRSSPIVVQEFVGTKVADRIARFYPLAVPEMGESPASFFSRNERLSYDNSSPEHQRKIDFEICVAKAAFALEKIPFLRRIARLNGLNTELYIGQETLGYVSNEEIEKGVGFGNDRYKDLIQGLKMGIIRQTRNLLVLIGTAVVINYCSNFTPGKSSYDPIIHFNGSFVMYEARKGESIEDLYESEGGDINNRRKFRNFQEDIYNATGRINGYDCMNWENGKLKITCPKIMWVPDQLPDEKTGKQKPEIQRQKLSYA